MSPSTLRRFRAERLLRQEFESLRARVISTVRGRLRDAGVGLDQSDLEACYGVAWQGLYAVMLDGQQIANPAGWLVLATFRRAIDEHRASSRIGSPSENVGWGDEGVATAHQRDLAADLDDRIRLRQLFEGLRGRLSARELQAATLCYLHDLTRAEAAAQMGVSESRMRKLMEGQGGERPGVAAKVGALVAAIRDGAWCAEQASLMRGYAFGILDPEGERYRLALNHRDECPACRAYVISLRGLAAALPPMLPPASLAAGLLGAGANAKAAGAGVAAPGASSGAGAPAGAGGAGGSWGLAGGSLGAKLAGCVLALGVGAGCIAVGSAAPHGHAPARRAAPTHAGSASALAGEPFRARAGSARARGRGGDGRPSRAAYARPTGRLGREFAPEQRAPHGIAAPPVNPPPTAGGAAAAGRHLAATAGTRAQREFGPG
jgi:DNA-directed RNA polymerase specialized sigma24 family protein